LFEKLNAYYYSSENFGQPTLGAEPATWGMKVFKVFK